MFGDFSSDAMHARGHITAPLFAALLLSACSTGQVVEVKINESAQGTVYLRNTPDGSLQAAHPIKIDSGTTALVLNGILIRDTLSVQKNSSDFSDARRVFSGSEVGYLAPLISEGFRRAASDQLVGFKVGQVEGTLYAYGRSLYVTLTQYHSPEDAPATAHMADTTVTDTTGLANRTLSFVPQAAKRPDTYLDARSTDRTLVIDYALLARLPAAAGVPASAQPVPVVPPPPAPIAEKADPAKKDSEMEALRKELQDIKKQLAEQQAERTRSQPQKPAPQ
jgi:hypothetical protein